MIEEGFLQDQTDVAAEQNSVLADNLPFVRILGTPNLILSLTSGRYYIDYYIKHSPAHQPTKTTT